MASHGKHQAHPAMTDLVRNAILLSLLMGATILAYKYDIGHFLAGLARVPNKDEVASYLNNIIAVTIAMVKAYLVIQIFMGVKYSSQLTKIYAWMGFVWFPLMLMIFGDYTTRHWENGAGWNQSSHDVSAFRSQVDKAEAKLHRENAHEHEGHGSGGESGGH